MIKTLIAGLRPLAVTLTLLAAPIAFPASASASEIPALPFQIGGPFELVDHHGNKVTEKDFGDRFLLVYFGYTYCPDICPSDLSSLGTALDDISPAALDRVQPLFITVDPARDTPAVMKDYVVHFHPRLVGLSGTEAQIAAAAKAYRVHRMKIVVPPDDPNEPVDPDDYLVNHTPNAYLIGPDGTFVTLFPHNSDAPFIAKILRKYLGDTPEAG